MFRNLVERKERETERETDLILKMIIPHSVTFAYR